MKIIQDSFELNLTAFQTSVFTENACFYDIETTGLSPKISGIYLIGILYRTGSTGHLIQFFAESIADEREVLGEFSMALAPFDRLISFNGISFDSKFLQKRMEKFGIDPDDFASKEQYDLLCRTRPLKKAFQLENLKQKTIEKFLKLPREDEMNGGQLIDVYFSYTLHPTEEDLVLLLLHNYEDVKNMTDLLPALSYCSLSEHLKEQVLDAAFTDNGLEWICPLNIRLEDQPLVIQEGFSFAIHDNAIRFILPPRKARLRHYYEGTGDYVYLIEEGRLLPKLLAGSIPSDKKRKASPEECSYSAEGLFCQLPKGFPAYGALCFQAERKSKDYYLFTEKELPSEDFLIRLVIYLLKSIKI